MKKVKSFFKNLAVLIKKFMEFAKMCAKWVKNSGFWPVLALFSLFLSYFQWNMGYLASVTERYGLFTESYG